MRIAWRDVTAKSHLPKLVFAVAAAVLLADALCLFCWKFSAFIHSDACSSVLMGAKALHARSPVFRDWYYANGDVWVLMPHLYAALAVALFGVGPGALRFGVVLGFLLEVGVLAWAYRHLSQARWVSFFAAVMTLIAWSRLHILFVFIELSYGYLCTLYVALFTLFALAFTQRATTLDVAPRSRLTRNALAVALTNLVLTSVMSPSRAAVFVLAPLLVACAWPWRDVRVRARLVVAGCVGAGWLGALLAYQLVFRRILTFSLPSGHSEFQIKDVSGLVHNIASLGKGFVALSGRIDGFDVFVIPALLMTAGAVALVAHEVFASRALTPMRFVSICIGTQLMATLFPMIIGNLIVNTPSARYLMTSLMPIHGLAAILAVSSQDARGLRRKAAMLWLALVPVVAVVSFVRLIGTFSLEAVGQWASREAHTDLARELTRRGLTRGFSTYWNANNVTLRSSGATKTCSVMFRDGLLPYKWNTDTECFDATTLPDRIYVVATAEEREAAEHATRISLHDPIDSFVVDDFFYVTIFNTKDASLGWLALPMPDGDAIRFPLRLPATHTALSRGKAIEEGGRLVATGDDGVVVYGPYMTVPKGEYTLRWTGAGVESPGELHFNIAIRGGKEVVAEQTVNASTLAKSAPASAPGSDVARMDFTLAHDSPAFEARLYSRGGAKVILDELVLEKR